MTHRSGVPLVAVVVSIVLVSGCGGYRAEYNGREFGEAMCDIADGDRSGGLEDAREALEDARRIRGVITDEDQQKIEGRLNGLDEAIAAGDDVLGRSDLESLRREVKELIDATSGRAQRFYQGVEQGLADCAG